MASEESVPVMSVDEFCDFLSTKFDDDVVTTLRENKISGASFTKLSERQLEKLVTAMGDVVELQALQEKIQKMTAPSFHLVS